MSRAARATVASRCDFLRRHRSVGQRPWRFSGPGSPRRTRLCRHRPQCRHTQCRRSRRPDAVDRRSCGSIGVTETGENRKTVFSGRSTTFLGTQSHKRPTAFYFHFHTNGPISGSRVAKPPLHTSGLIAAVSRSKQINNAYKNILENANYEHESVKAFILLSLVH